MIASQFPAGPTAIVLTVVGLIAATMLSRPSRRRKNRAQSSR